MAKYALPDHQYKPLEARANIARYYENLGRDQPALLASDACMLCILDKDKPPHLSSYVWRFSANKHPSYIIFEQP